MNMKRLVLHRGYSALLFSISALMETIRFPLACDVMSKLASPISQGLPGFFSPPAFVLSSLLRSHCATWETSSAVTLG